MMHAAAFTEYMLAIFGLFMLADIAALLRIKSFMKRELGEGYGFLPEKGSASLFSKKTRYILYAAFAGIIIWEYAASDSGYYFLLSFSVFLIPLLLRYFLGFGGSVLDTGYPQLYHKDGKLVFLASRFFVSKKSFIVSSPSAIESIRIGQRQGYMNFWIVQLGLAGGRQVSLLLPDSEKSRLEKLLGIKL